MKWTKRRNGQEMATFRIRYHVPREMIDWLRDNGEMSQAEAFSYLIDHAHNLDREFSTLWAHREDHDIEIAEEHDLGIPDEWIRYEGPWIIISR